ncbi:MAG TPA: glycosyltransferase [Polyangia bacterium]|nr:glycosyltransferase [Polyangia bacterium]
MRFVMLYHSLVSDWNHGNAHFLRGVARELLRRGHEVAVHEPAGGWSRSNLCADHGSEPLARFEGAYPELAGVARPYDDARAMDLDDVLDGADVVIVHEWTDPALVARVGAHHARHPPRYRLLFHDTHHRAVTDPQALAAFDLSAYDGVLAFGVCLRDLYLTRGWARRAWTWHEAADTSLFQPRVAPADGDLVWIGNWGDDERTAELHEFLIEPVRALGLRARVYGVRYPEAARRALAAAGIEYAGWLPNFDVPSVFARFRVTVHVPRRPYVEALPGIPTIRPFEALACGIPLVSAPWRDLERLFTVGRDYLAARDGGEMRRQLEAVLADTGLATRLSAHGRRTIAARHTCAHRVDQLLDVVSQLADVAGPRARAQLAAAS